MMSYATFGLSRDWSSDFALFLAPADNEAVKGGGKLLGVPLPGARNIRILSARFIADMQTHWEKHGMEALDTVFQKFPDRYVDNYVMLARVIRLEADVKHSMAKPKTVDEALAELESKVGKEGRRKFEKFLREVAKDKDDVTPKISPSRLARSACSSLKLVCRPSNSTFR